MVIGIERIQKEYRRLCETLNRPAISRQSVRTGASSAWSDSRILCGAWKHNGHVGLDSAGPVIYRQRWMTTE